MSANCPRGKMMQSLSDQTPPVRQPGSTWSSRASRRARGTRRTQRNAGACSDPVDELLGGPACGCSPGCGMCSARSVRCAMRQCQAFPTHRLALFWPIKMSGPLLRTKPSARRAAPRPAAAPARSDRSIRRPLARRAALTSGVSCTCLVRRPGAQKREDLVPRSGQRWQDDALASAEGRPHRAAQPDAAPK